MALMEIGSSDDAAAHAMEGSMDEDASHIPGTIEEVRRSFSSGHQNHRVHASQSSFGKRKVDGPVQQSNGSPLKQSVPEYLNTYATSLERLVEGDQTVEMRNARCGTTENATRVGRVASRFRLGDMVWGKVKSHPWWPGQIFDPASASSIARMSYREGHVLVAFFGDSTFGWFPESELLPFEPNFAQKSKQTTARSFIVAVEDALEEVGRRVKLGLTCACPKHAKVMHKGTSSNERKQRAVLNLDKQILEIRKSFDPARLLAFVKGVARSPLFSSRDTLWNEKAAAQLHAFRDGTFTPRNSNYIQCFKNYVEMEDIDERIEDEEDSSSDDLLILGDREGKPNAAAEQLAKACISKERDSTSEEVVHSHVVQAFPKEYGKRLKDRSLEGNKKRRDHKLLVKCFQKDIAVSIETSDKVKGVEENVKVFKERRSKDDFKRDGSELEKVKAIVPNKTISKEIPEGDLKEGRPEYEKLKGVVPNKIVSKERLEEDLREGTSKFDKLKCGAQGRTVEVYEERTLEGDFNEGRSEDENLKADQQMDKNDIKAAKPMDSAQKDKTISKKRRLEEDLKEGRPEDEKVKADGVKGLLGFKVAKADGVVPKVKTVSREILPDVDSEGGRPEDEMVKIYEKDQKSFNERKLKDGLIGNSVLKVHTQKLLLHSAREKGSLDESKIRQPSKLQEMATVSQLKGGCETSDMDEEAQETSRKAVGEAEAVTGTVNSVMSLENKLTLGDGVICVGDGNKASHVQKGSRASDMPKVDVVDCVHHEEIPDDAPLIEKLEVDFSVSHAISKKSKGFKRLVKSLKSMSVSKFRKADALSHQQTNEDIAFVAVEGNLGRGCKSEERNHMVDRPECSGNVKGRFKHTSKVALVESEIKNPGAVFLWQSEGQSEVEPAGLLNDQKMLLEPHAGASELDSDLQASDGERVESIRKMQASVFDKGHMEGADVSLFNENVDMHKTTEEVFIVDGVSRGFGDVDLVSERSQFVNGTVDAITGSAVSEVAGYIEVGTPENAMLDNKRKMINLYSMEVDGKLQEEKIERAGSETSLHVMTGTEIVSQTNKAVNVLEVTTTFETGMFEEESLSSGLQNTEKPTQDMAHTQATLLSCSDVEALETNGILSAVAVEDETLGSVFRSTQQAMHGVMHAEDACQPSEAVLKESISLKGIVRESSPSQLNDNIDEKFSKKRTFPGSDDHCEASELSFKKMKVVEDENVLPETLKAFLGSGEGAPHDNPESSEVQKCGMELMDSDNAEDDGPNQCDLASRSESLNLQHLLGELLLLAAQPLYVNEREVSLDAKGAFTKFREAVFQKDLNDESFVLRTESSSNQVDRQAYLDNWKTSDGKLEAGNERLEVLEVKTTEQGLQKRAHEDSLDNAEKRMNATMLIPSTKKNSTGTVAQGLTTDASMLLQGHNRSKHDRRHAGKRANQMHRVGSHRSDMNKALNKPAALFMKFPQGFALPSVTQLRATFVRFGSLDPARCRIYCDRGCAQVVFQHASDAEVALRYAQENNVFGQASVSFSLKQVSEASDTKSHRLLDPSKESKSRRYEDSFGMKQVSLKDAEASSSVLDTSKESKSKRHENLPLSLTMQKQDATVNNNEQTLLSIGSQTPSENLHQTRTQGPVPLKSCLKKMDDASGSAAKNVARVTFQLNCAAENTRSLPNADCSTNTLMSANQMASNNSFEKLSPGLQSSPRNSTSLLGSAPPKPFQSPVPVSDIGDQLMYLLQQVSAIVDFSGFEL